MFSVACQVFFYNTSCKKKKVVLIRNKGLHGVNHMDTACHTNNKSEK